MPTETYSITGRCTLITGAAQLRPDTEMAPKSPLLCVNRGPIRYDFRARAKAVIRMIV